MTLAALGEDALLARLLRGLPVGADVIAGPGDDCAIIGRPRDRRWLLLKADCVIEGVHFTRDADPRRVGWKALCRALSDIAAMAGTPRHALITVAAPRTLPVAWLEGLYAGLAKAARKFGAGIVGGETARSPGGIFIDVALTGEVARTRCIRRSGGREGDAIYVTGRLGGSLAGRHLDFIPRLAEARWLAEHFRPSAMMDLSDGLGADLPRLARASGCGFALDDARIPRTRGRSLAQVFDDGEDYELLFTIADAARLEVTWQKTFPKLPLTRIGTLTRNPNPQTRTPPRGFDHFRQTL
ncbi:MAG: thiamine-phosphate kinase [Chthoniobacteraceae bacterium]